ncbi:MAG: DUF983 domain-containing protein [Sphingomonadales bacterium]|nr:DUF983 domain-containing protein [Sphingomonadales bacterium]
MTDRPTRLSFTQRPIWWRALGRGLRRRCPHCGQGNAFAGYLKLRPACASCGAALGEIRADDAPPYFTILTVGHIVVPAMLLTEQLAHPPVALHMALWPALTAALTLAFLPCIKGAVVGVMWATGITGDERR